MSNNSRQSQSQRKSLKNTDLTEESRKKREETNLSIRKIKREQSLEKKRNVAISAPDELATNSTLNSSSSANNIKNEDLLKKLNDLPHLVQQLNSEDLNQCLDATISFRKLLSIEKNPPIQKIINIGVIPKFIDFLKKNKLSTIAI